MPHIQDLKVEVDERLAWLNQWREASLPPFPTVNLLEMMDIYTREARIRFQNSRTEDMVILKGFKVVKLVDGRLFSTYLGSTVEYRPGRVLYELAKPDHSGGLYMHCLTTLDHTIEAFAAERIVDLERRMNYAVLAVTGWGPRYFYDDDGYLLPHLPGRMPGNYKKVAVSWLYVQDVVMHLLYCRG